MDKHQILAKIKESGLVAVVRAEAAERVFEITEACIEGGVASIELTFTVPFAHGAIESLARRYGDEIILGAGTVLDAETARIALLSGARYIVSPCLSLETVRLCNRYRVPVMPGIMTIKEAVEAMEAGADMLKLFPGELFGPKFIRSIKWPLPHAEIMPTGGVDASNAAEWIKAGAAALGAGGSIIRGGREQIVAAARKFIQNIKAARSALS